MALTAGVHTIPSIGVEYDIELVGRAEHHIGFLRKSLILNHIPITIAQGDFTEDETYARVGIRFEDIGIIFNYRNNENRIAEKIVRQSPPGTKFLLYTPQKSHKFEGLTLEQSLIFDKQYKDFTNYLHVYRK